LSRPPEFEGAFFSIQALTRPDGSCPAGDFLDSLSGADRQKLDVLFEYLGNHGRLSNREKFKKVENSAGIWEFKSFQIRVLCFFAPGKRVMLAAGAIKKKDKLTRSDIERAELFKKEFEGS
jgi:hypothetical protein